MNLDKTGYLSVNTSSTEIKKDKSISVPNPAFKGQIDEKRITDNAVCVSSGVVKAYLGIKTKENTESEIKAEPFTAEELDNYGWLSQIAKSKLLRLSQNYPDIRKLVELKDNEGKPVFLFHQDIDFLKEYCQNEKDLGIVKKLAELKNEDGKSLLSAYAISQTVEDCRDDDFLNVFLNFQKITVDKTTARKKYRFNNVEIKKLANIYKEDPDLVKFFAEAKTKDGKELDSDIIVFLAKNLIEIKNADPSKYERIKNSGIFELIKDNKLDVMVLKKLNKNSDLTSDMYKDLEAVKSGKSIVSEFPEGTDLKTAFENTNEGDVVEVGSQMYINNGHKLSKWEMTKEKYLELFPPVERFASIQGETPNCYLIQALSHSMNNPAARVKFLKSFSLKGDDVVVTIKGLGDYNSSKTFPNGEITLPDKGKHIVGCKGMQMYEQAYSCLSLRSAETLKNNPSDIDYYNPETKDINKIVDRGAIGHGTQAFADIFGQGTINDILGIPNTNSYDSRGYSHIPVLNSEGKIIYKNPNWLFGSELINTFDSIFKNFPKKTIGLIRLDEMAFETLVSHTANNKDFLVSFGTISQAGLAREGVLQPEYNLVSGHAYAIEGYDEKTGLVKIINPHSCAEVTEIPIDVLHKYVQHLDFIKLK